MHYSCPLNYNQFWRATRARDHEYSPPDWLLFKTGARENFWTSKLEWSSRINQSGGKISDTFCVRVCYEKKKSGGSIFRADLNVVGDLLSEQFIKKWHRYQRHSRMDIHGYRYRARIIPGKNDDFNPRSRFKSLPSGDIAITTFNLETPYPITCFT